MNCNKLSTGHDIPNDINVLIEIPAKGGPVKYEVDKDTESLFVDRFLGTSMVYPTNYGYVPKTLSEDGDPVDVLVLTPAPVMAGSVIRSRPIGMLKMMDEKGVDVKILAVPIDKLCSIYRHVNTPDDVAPDLIASITHFFEHYKDLEEGKWVKIDGWVGAEDAKAEILASVERYKK